MGTFPVSDKKVLFLSILPISMQSVLFGAANRERFREEKEGPLNILNEFPAVSPILGF